MENTLKVCGFKGNIAFFLFFFFFLRQNQNAYQLSITAESDFFFLLSRSWILRVMPGWALPQRISVVAAIKHIVLFAARIFVVHGFWPLPQPRVMRHLSRVSPWPGLFGGFVLHEMPCAMVTWVALLVSCREVSTTSTSKLNVLLPVSLPVRKCQEIQLRTNISFLFLPLLWVNTCQTFPGASLDRNQLHLFYCKISRFWTGAPGRSFLWTSVTGLLIPNVTAVLSLMVALISSSDLHEWPLGCSFRCWLLFITLSRALQTCPSGTSNSCSFFAGFFPTLAC